MLLCTLLCVCAAALTASFFFRFSSLIFATAIGLSISSGSRSSAFSAFFEPDEPPIMKPSTISGVVSWTSFLRSLSAASVLGAYQRQMIRHTVSRSTARMSGMTIAG